jgi:hypothetical protein
MAMSMPPALAPAPALTSLAQVEPAGQAQQTSQTQQAQHAQQEVQAPQAQPLAQVAEAPALAPAHAEAIRQDPFLDPNNPWMLALAEHYRQVRVQNQFDAWTSAQHAEPIGHVPVGPTDAHAALQEIHQAHHDIALVSAN